MSLDVARARRETPGCESVVHLNNAGASLMPDVVLGTVIEHLELEARIGGGREATNEEPRAEGKKVAGLAQHPHLSGEGKCVAAIARPTMLCGPTYKAP
jgi:hypothetical protein